MVSRALRSALDKGAREALVVLLGQLGKEIDESSSARDRLPLVRAFLASLRALEALDAAARREARDEARKALSGDLSGSSARLDELLDRRKRRGHAS